MVTEQSLHFHRNTPSPQSLLVVVNMQDERLEPPPQSFKFTPQQPQQHYRYNSHLFKVSREDFMSNLIGTNRTPESAYAYMQSILIPSFASFHLAIVGSSLTSFVNDLNSQSTNQTNFNLNYNEFILEEQPVVADEHIQPHKHGRVHRKPTRNRQAPRCETRRHR